MEWITLNLLRMLRIAIICITRNGVEQNGMEQNGIQLERNAGEERSGIEHLKFTMNAANCHNLKQTKCSGTKWNGTDKIETPLIYLECCALQLNLINQSGMSGMKQTEIGKTCQKGNETFVM